MSNNIYKANFIQFSPENTKVIDTNSLVAKRLEGFSTILREEENIPETSAEEDGFQEIAISDLLADREEETSSEVSFEDANAYLEEMKQQGMAEIEEMKQAALQEIDEMRAELYEEAKRQGYSEGMAQSEAEYKKKLDELERRGDELEKEYSNLAISLEPKIVDAITDIYRKVFGNSFYSNRDVILSLVTKALINIGNEDDIIIHVSSLDYDEICERNEEILACANYRRAPEIKPEDRYEKGEIKIETKYGIVDCGIDTELEELTKALKMLSYEGSDL